MEPVYWMNNEQFSATRPAADWKIRVLSGGVKLESESSGVSFRLDNNGRWCSFRDTSNFYRRCWNGEVVSGADAMTVNSLEKATLHRKIQGKLSELAQLSGWDSGVQSLLQKGSLLSDCDFDELETVYQSSYPEDVPILPPDRYGDVVIQPAAGCPNRRCTFCAFYQDKPFKVLSEQAFDEHLQQVVHLFGLVKDQVSGVFIGSANAMALSQRRLMSCIEQIERHLGQPKRGFSAFSDPDFSAPRTDSEWQALSDKGLRHLVVGLETGWAELRSRLGKSGDLSKVRHAVASHQKAGIATGLTVLSGACELSENEENRNKTAEFIQSLALERSDLVYVSPLESGDVDRKEAVKEQKTMQTLLKSVTSARVVPYQMHRFRYFC